MNSRSLSPIFIILLLLSSCERDIESRNELFLPELKFGTPKAQLVPLLERNFEYIAEANLFTGSKMPFELSVTFDRDSNLNEFVYRYYHNGIDMIARAQFDRESNRLMESQGTPDDWMRRDSLGGQRMVWYYAKDSSVISIELRRSGLIEIGAARSGQRFRDTKYEMANFFSSPD